MASDTYISQKPRNEVVPPIHVRLLRPSDEDEWARLRAALWPDCSAEQHQQEMAGILRHPGEEAVFVSSRPDERLQGFLEVSIRPYAHGCESRPVGYIEGWYVEPDARRKGVGRALVAAGEEWARSKGCQEMASDAEVENTLSHLAHRHLGYKEVERLVHFRKEILPLTEPTRDSGTLLIQQAHTLQRG